ncbi:MAG: hypothetical protein IMZ75_14940 [Actinobacteria bacterium]|nr:hypothetical protein [Actinomycetota bacterium]
MRPMLASAGTVIPGGPEWAHEIKCVVEVQYLGLSAQGRLRQPAYLGLRPDLSPVDLHDQG